MSSQKKWSKAVCAVLALNLLASSIASAATRELSQDQIQKLNAIVKKEASSLDRLSNEQVVAEFEALSAKIDGTDEVRLTANASGAHKDQVAQTMIRYSALREKVSTIPGAKEKVYVKLFG